MKKKLDILLSDISRTKISDLVIQIISVTIGVFLGFVISNWSQNSRESNKQNLLIKNIEAEINSNKNKVESRIDYHIAVRDSSRNFLMKNDSNQTKLHFFKGVNTVTFDNSAYQTGIQTGLFNTMDFDIIQSINEIYTKQRSYEDFANLILAGLIKMDTDNNSYSERKLANFLSISMTDLVIKEKELSRIYNKTLNLIDEYKSVDN